MRADERERRLGSYLLYNGALAVASPLLLSWYLYRVFGSGKSRDGWMERLGAGSGNAAGNAAGDCVWFHAVSVGETVAVRPVVDAFRRLSPEPEVILSSVTSTGRTMARKILPQTRSVYLPVDILPSVRAVVRRYRPLAAAICESEIWPNFLNELQGVGCRVAMVNGVVSDGTLRRSGRYRWLYRWALGNIDEFHMQSDEDAARIIELGAPEARVQVSGNTKFDEAEEPLDEQEAESLRKELGFGPNQPVLVAGSTNPGEEEVVLKAFCEARQTVSDLGLVIAPRQIERGEQIAQMAHRMALQASRWSDPHRQPAPVVVLDTFGMLAKVYAVGRVAFVGGTFIDKGGHNILQPLAQGVPVVYGPYDYKIRDISRAAAAAGVAFGAADEKQFLEYLLERLMEPPGSVRGQALSFISRSRGASLRCAQAVHRLAQQTHSERSRVAR